VVRYLKAVRWQTWAMAGVVALGAVLRFWGLGSESLWVDEISTLGQIQGGVFATVPLAIVNGTPPFYYMIQSVLHAILPAGESSIRLLSAVADVGSIVLILVIGRRLFTERVALLAAALYAISYRALWFAQEARAYSLSIALTLLAVYTLLRLLDRPSWGRAALHAVVVVCLLYTHVYAVFAIAGIELGFMVRSRLRERLGHRWLVALAVSVVAYVPWMLVLYGQATQRMAGVVDSGYWSIAKPGNLLTTGLHELADLAPWGMRYIPYGGVGVAVGGVMVALFALGLFALWQARAAAGPEPLPEASEGCPAFALGTADTLSIAAGWFGMVFVGGLLVSKFVMPIFSFRMATQVLPLVCLLVANGLDRVGRWWRPAAILLVAGLLVVTVPGLARYYGAGHAPMKEPWRAAIAYVDGHRAESDFVLVSAPFIVRMTQLYASEMGLPLRVRMTPVERTLAQGALEAEVAGLLAGRKRVMVLSSHVDVDSQGVPAIENAVLATPGWTRAAGVAMTGIRIWEFVHAGP
jgi:mannosyltransferase